MSMTCTCFDGHHEQCGGKVSKWSKDPGDIVLETGIIASDGVGVTVACSCNCHATITDIERERFATVREYA